MGSLKTHCLWLFALQHRALEDAIESKRVVTDSLQRELHTAQVRAAAVHVLEADNERLRSELDAHTRKHAVVDPAVLNKEVTQLHEKVPLDA